MLSFSPLPAQLMSCLCKLVNILTILLIISIRMLLSQIVAWQEEEEDS